MDIRFSDYLEKGTALIQSIFSDGSVTEEEKTLIVHAFSAELKRNIGKDTGFTDYQPLIYGISVRLLDRQISEFMSKNSAEKTDFDKTLKLCERQKKLIELFRTSGWELPKINYPDIDACVRAINTSIEENKRKEEEEAERIRKQKEENKRKKEEEAERIRKQKEENKRKAEEEVERIRKQNVIKAKIIMGAIAICLLLAAVAALSIFIMYKKSLAKVPFENSYVVNKDLDTIREELEQAGFENIVTTPLIDGWDKSNLVKRVTIDGSDQYNQGDEYKKSEAKVVIEFTSPDRIYVTDILKDWEGKDYEALRQDLLNAGIKNITSKEDYTQDEKQVGKVSSVEIGGIKYTDEKCYLPDQTQIVMTSYVYKISLGRSSKQFIGQEHNSVRAELERRGFTNIEEKEVTTGWSKDNTINTIEVNGSNYFGADDHFDPDAAIKIQYSSSGRVNITDYVFQLNNKNYGDLLLALQQKGFKDITLENETTEDRSLDKKVSKLLFNHAEYTYDGGDCYIPQDTSIRIIRYVIKEIELGFSSEEVKGQNYTEVVKQLKDKGFKNITLKRTNDVVAGLITKEGSIKSMEIAGYESYSEMSKVEYDNEIIIIVNTKKDGCDDITLVAD